MRRLEELIRASGGTSARSRTPDEYARSFPRLAAPGDALRFAADLEERLVRAYLQALPKLSDPELRRALAEIGADEGAHLAVVHVLRGRARRPAGLRDGNPVRPDASRPGGPGRDSRALPAAARAQPASDAVVLEELLVLERRLEAAYAAALRRGLLPRPSGSPPA